MPDLIHDMKERERVEDPVVSILTKHLQWDEISAKDADAMRGSKKEVFLYPKLRDAINRINPWINDENREQVVRALTRIPSISDIEANEKSYDMLERGITIRQDLDDGRGLRGHDVKLIDYEKTENNQFAFIRQFRVDHVDEKNPNIPDLVLFINGIPVAVIECKSPTLRNPMEEGHKQVFRYQECQEKFRNIGCPRLFQTVQIIAVLTGDDARFGTNFTPWRHWSQWLDVYPLTLDEVSKTLDKKLNKQELLLFGMFRKENILDLIQNFVVFERESKGIVKKVAKYMQYRAVNRTIGQVTTTNRYGGIIWHWQGSGKSHTMLWIAVKLRRVKDLQNPAIVVVTDRIALDQQIFQTFEHCGFPKPERAKSAKHLKELLTSPTGRTIMTTVQKFQDAAEIYPVLTEDPNIFVLTDEAHESQYGWFAANMRNAIINGCFLAFTGTPISKNDRNTFEKFGTYIDRYDHNKSMEDGITVPIKYLGKLPEMQLTNGTIDEVFERIFKSYSKEEREKIKKKYVTREAIATAPQRIQAVANNIISHYTTTIQPNGFKAQIVAVSRDAAIDYYNAIRELNGPSCDVLISAVHNDEKKFADFQRSRTEEQEIIRRFKDEIDPQIIIVCDKLIQGFDAPIEQVQYLDKPLKEHTLLQAIGRVNRKMHNKEYGLIVDYWGLLTELNDALGMYSKDVSQGMIETDYIPQLINQTESARNAAIAFFQSVPRKGIRALDDEACIDYLDPEDQRIRFNQLFKAFAGSLDMLLPEPAALKFKKDFDWLVEIRLRARQRLRDADLDISDCSGKVKQLIAQHLAFNGITELNEEPVSIFSNQFDKLIDSLPSSNSKSSEISHAVSHEISVKTHEDPVFYESLKERLTRIIQESRQKRIDEQVTLDELGRILHDVRNPRVHGESLGVTPEIAPLYALLARDVGEVDGLKDTTREIYDILISHAVVGWDKKIDAQREMRKSIKDAIRTKGLKVQNMEPLVAQILQLAKGRFDHES